VGGVETQLLAALPVRRSDWVGPCFHGTEVAEDVEVVEFVEVAEAGS
jgi:hypothetical protein